MKELVNKLSSKTIDDLVLSFRSGNREAGEKLITSFAPIIGKYLNLFFHGKYNPKDTDIVKFLQTCGKADIDKTADILRTKLRKYEAEELIHICKVALLDTAKNYVSISGTYKYVLYKYIEVMLKEDFPLGMPYMDLSEIELFGAPENIVEVKIDDKWIKGDSAGEGFSSLSENERKIVKLCWYDKIPDVHICGIMNMSIYQLRNSKIEIKNKLSKVLHINNE